MTSLEGSANEGQNRKAKIAARRKELQESINPDRKEIGERLRLIRLAKGLSQKDVSKLFHTSNGQGHISSYERGVNNVGKNIRRNYILLLGANRDYIDHGTLPMFKTTGKGENQAERMVDALQERTSGNLRLVTKKDLGQFLNTGYATSVSYPFLPGDCYSLPVGTYEMGRDFPFNSQIICIRVYSVNSLLEGRVCAFQTNHELFVRIYAGLVSDGFCYRLTAPYGEDVLLPVGEVTQLYHVERIDKPVE